MTVSPVSVLRALLSLFFMILPGAAHAQDAVARLPRAEFEVIAPSERIAGERGEMRVRQPACRVGPTHWARRRIVDVAVQEWAFFGFQTIDATQVAFRRLPLGLVPEAKNPLLAAPRIARDIRQLGTSEDQQRVDQTIAGYWSATPDGESIISHQNEAWNGPGGGAVNWVEPWSAAFVSWVMCEAGLGDMQQFARAIAHRIYIDQAIHARDGTAPEAAYVAYDAGERRIEPGDLLCNSREGTDYRSLADRRPEMGRYAPAHCDIVVSIPASGDRVLVIGGNVLQSVSLTILQLAREGSAFPRPVGKSAIDGARTVFAHLKLRADPVPANALDTSPTIRELARE